MKKLYELFNMEVESEDKDGNPVMVSPEFIVKVQDKTKQGIHILIHALGHSSNTTDLIINENEVKNLNDKLIVHHADKYKECRWLIYTETEKLFWSETNWLIENPWNAKRFYSEIEAKEYLDEYKTLWNKNTKIENWCIQQHLFVYI